MLICSNFDIPKITTQNNSCVTDQTDKKKTDTVYTRIEVDFWGGKGEFSEVPRLIRVTYFLLAERCSGPFWIHNTVGFNPIRVRKKSPHRCLLIHYYSINNNSFSPNCYLDLTNMPVFM